MLLFPLCVINKQTNKATCSREIVSVFDPNVALQKYFIHLIIFTASQQLKTGLYHISTNISLYYLSSTFISIVYSMNKKIRPLVLEINSVFVRNKCSIAKIFYSFVLYMYIYVCQANEYNSWRTSFVTNNSHTQRFIYLPINSYVIYCRCSIDS